MDLKFDIDDDSNMSVTIYPDKSEDEAELNQLANRLFINNPIKDILKRAQAGAFNHLSEKSYSHYLAQIKSLESFFEPDETATRIPAYSPMRRVNIFLFLERLINAYLNIPDDTDYDEEDVVE